MWVMSLTNLTLGTAAVKFLLTKSGITTPASGSACVVTLNGRGWHGIKCSWRMIWRASSGEHCVASATRSAWIRRYPYVSSETSKNL